MVELEGSKGLFVTRKSRRMCSVWSVSLRLSVLNGFRGRFVPKEALLGHQNARFWEGTSLLGAPTPGRHC